MEDMAGGGGPRRGLHGATVVQYKRKGGSAASAETLEDWRQLVLTRTDIFLSTHFGLWSSLIFFAGEWAGRSAVRRMACISKTQVAATAACGFC